MLRLYNVDSIRLDQPASPRIRSSQLRSHHADPRVRAIRFGTLNREAKSPIDDELRKHAHCTRDTEEDGVEPGFF